MKNSKLKFILALLVVLTLVTPFATYATDIDAQELSTSETTGDNTQPVDETEDEGIENPEETTGEDGTEPVEGEDVEGTETEDETTPELEEVSGNYYETNTDIVLNKAIDGNAFLLGDNVTINGAVNGDLYVCANNVELTKDAKVFGNLFLIADNFTQTGLVYNLFAFTTNYTCEYDGLTGFDLKVFADNIKFSGYVERSAYFVADNIELTDDAYIMGNVVYSSNNEPVIGEAATIYGDTTNEDIFRVLSSNIDTSNQIVEYIMSAVILLVTALLVLFVLNFFKPNAMSTNLKFDVKKYLKDLGIGLLSIIVISVIAIVLFISGIFAKFALILSIATILALLLSAFVVIISVAIMLYNKFNKGKSKLFVFLYTALVSIVYFALTIIPIVGIIIKAIFNLIGFGAIVLYFFKIRNTNKITDGKATVEKKIAEPKKDKALEKNNKDKNKDKNSDKEKEKEAEKNKDKNNDKEKDKNKDNDKNKDKDKDNDKEKDKNKDNNKGKDKDKNKENSKNNDDNKKDSSKK